MRILIDMSSALPAGNIVTNGGGEYAMRILSELVVQKKKNVLEILLDNKKKSNESLNSVCKQYNLRIVYFECIRDIERIIKENQYDKVFFPVLYPHYYKLNLDNQKTIGVIHDLSSYDELCIKTRIADLKIKNIDRIKMFIKWNFLKFFFREIERNKHIRLFQISKNTENVTVSQYSKKHIEKCIFEAKEINMKVFYSPAKNVKAITEASFKENILRKNNIVKDQYFLMINGSRWLKNNYRVLLVLDSIFSKDVNFSYKVVILGVEEEYRKYYYKKIVNKERFIMGEFVEAEELELLYRDAHAFIYPSLLEGFGYPPLEAMKYGTLCLCSNHCSIPEICGDAVIYFDPLSSESIQKAIRLSCKNNFIDKKKINKQHHLITTKQNEDLCRLKDFIFEESDETR